MVQATTPTFVLTLPKCVDLTLAQNIVFTITQNSLKYVKESSKNELDYTERQVSVYLTQEETLQFTKGVAKLQLNWVYSDGRRACSNIVSIDVSPNLLTEVLE